MVPRIFLGGAKRASRSHFNWRFCVVVGWGFSRSSPRSTWEEWHRQTKAGLLSRVLAVCSSLPFCFLGSVPELLLKRSSDTVTLPSHQKVVHSSCGIEEEESPHAKTLLTKGIWSNLPFMENLRPHCLWWLSKASLLWKKRRWVGNLFGSCVSTWHG